jgi:hypothetical protein
MFTDIKRHRLLKFLAKKRKDLISIEDPDDIIGVSRENMMKKLSCSELGLNIIISEMVLSKEIDHYDINNIKGFFLRDEGFKELVNRKYTKRFWKYYGDIVKKTVEISIPVLSLLVALIAVSSSRKDEQYRQENQINILQLQKQIDKLNIDYETHENTKNDTLKIK